jgi:hypothetical protein
MKRQGGKPHLQDPVLVSAEPSAELASSTLIALTGPERQEDLGKVLLVNLRELLSERAAQVA